MTSDPSFKLGISLSEKNSGMSLPSKTRSWSINSVYEVVAAAVKHLCYALFGPLDVLANLKLTSNKELVSTSSSKSLSECRNLSYIASKRYLDALPCVQIVFLLKSENIGIFEIQAESFRHY